MECHVYQRNTNAFLGSCAFTAFLAFNDTTNAFIPSYSKFTPEIAVCCE